MVKKALLCFLLTAVLFHLATPRVYSQEHQNNKFGIHISDLNEVKKASELVNSNGGEWGYVSFVINSNDRTFQKWQERMNALNDKKLIPIVRLATYGNGASWTKPVKDDAHDWAVFLKSLYWPTKKKIVVVYNEPNHGAEWGAEANAAEYARTLQETADALHEADKDFIVLNAGFDASAPQEAPKYIDQVHFMDEMEKSVPGIFNKLDGWASHSYPNPGFSGSVQDTGRGSIQTYKWEIDLLRTRYGVSKELPVYITETGWVTKNADYPKLRYDEIQTAELTRNAFEDIWGPDSSVHAVTPFMLVYKQPLFSHFSWLRADDSETPTYSAIKLLPKVKGEVEQELRSAITTVDIPSQIQKGREFIASIAFKNTGNSIWNDGDTIMLAPEDQNHLIIRDQFSVFDGKRVFPGQTYVYKFTIFRNDLLRRSSLAFQMKKDSVFFGEKLFVPIKIFQPPTITLAFLNPPKEKIEHVSLKFSNPKESDIVPEVTINTKGEIGTFTSFTFIPEEDVTIQVLAPNRDSSEVTFKIQEGGNFVSLTLAPEYPFWKKLFQLVNGRSSSS